MNMLEPELALDELTEEISERLEKGEEVEIELRLQIEVVLCYYDKVIVKPIGVLHDGTEVINFGEVTLKEEDSFVLDNPSFTVSLTDPTS